MAKEQNIEISKKILKITGSTNAQLDLIKEGDKVLLGLSGGKDSILLATLLARLKNMHLLSLSLRQLRLIMGAGASMNISLSIARGLESPMNSTAQIFIRFWRKTSVRGVWFVVFVRVCGEVRFIRKL